MISHKKHNERDNMGGDALVLFLDEIKMDAGTGITALALKL